MLKFLENRQEKSVARQTIRNKPHVGFGISLESPAEFQHEHSMISSNTFVSPYLPFEPARKSVIPLEKLHLVCPKWTRKTDLTQIETSVLSTDRLKNYDVDPYLHEYHQELKKDSARFWITKGEFSNFLERNQTNRNFGPLMGQERSPNRSEETKQLIRKKSKQSLDKSRSRSKLTDDTSRNCGSQLYNHVNQIMGIKRKLRKLRENLKSSFANEVETHRPKSIFQLNLPKIKQTPSQKSSIGRSLNNSVNQQILLCTNE